jgi:ankyrin repeat protein
MSKFAKTIGLTFYKEKLEEVEVPDFELPTGEGLIHIGVINSDKDLIKKIVEKNKEILEWRNEQGRSPFSFALSLGNKTIADFLLGMGANINTKTRTFKVVNEGAEKSIERNDIPVLIEMVILGRKEFVEFLVKRGCDINGTDSLGFTALNYAIFLNRKSIVDYLIKNKADVNIFPNYEEKEHNLKIDGEDVKIKRGNLTVFKSPLFIASIYGDDDLFKVVSKQANINIFDEGGNSILNHLFKLKKYDRMLEIIKNVEIYENSYNMNGDCLSHEIVRELDEPFEIIKFLKSKGLDFEKKNMEGKTIVVVGVEKAKKKIVFLKKMKKLGAEVKDEDFDDRKEINDAIPKEDLDTIQAIIKDKTRNVKLDFVDADTQTFIHKAVFYQKLNIIDYFLKLNYKLIDLENGEGLTPFYYAIQNKKTESVEFLLEKLKDVEKSGKLIYYLVKTNDSSYNDIIKRLIVSGHDVNYKEEKDRLNTPLHVAIENDNHEIASVLISSGAKMDVKNVKGITPASIMRKLPSTSKIIKTREMRMKFGGGVM